MDTKTITFTQFFDQIQQQTGMMADYLLVEFIGGPSVETLMDESKAPPFSEFAEWRDEAIDQLGKRLPSRETDQNIVVGDYVLRKPTYGERQDISRSRKPHRKVIEATLQEAPEDFINLDVIPAWHGLSMLEALGGTFRQHGS